MRAALNEADQIRAMTRAFLGRFFENEITAGTDDMKTSFFWLLSFLAVPGFFMPMMLGFTWNLIALVQGVDALRVLSRMEKTLYLGYVMIAAASITAIAWNSLMGDRRDALVLGVLPVRPFAVVCARLGALAIYMGIIGVSMNVLASVVFGLNLAARNTLGFAARGIAAHFAASVAMSSSVFLAVTGVQGIVLATLGPRLFARAAPVLQVLLVGFVVAGFLSLPGIVGAVVPTLAGQGGDVRPWILSTPPLWFLGLYERVLGTSDPVLIRLSRHALLALVAGLAATVVTYPIAYRRVLSSVLEQGGGLTRPPAARVVAGLLTRSMGRAAHVRAASQFFLAALGRVEGHRFVLAATVGLVVAWVMPGWMSMAASRPAAPRVLLLSLSYSAMAFLVYGLNVAASLPADLKSSWLFDVVPPSRAGAHAALERTLFLFGVAPPMLVFLPLYGSLWGASFALTHGLFMLLMGTLLVEFALRRSGAMPCAQPWDPQSLDLGRWWGAYLIGFILYTTKVPDIELSLRDSAAGIAAFSALAVGGIVTLRVHARRRRAAPTDTSAFAPGDVLSLN